MTCSSCSPQIKTAGAVPVNIQWNIVRGDTGRLVVGFLEADEVTTWDTDAWTYKATAYDKITDISDELNVIVSPGYAVIDAPAELTTLWGEGYNPVARELLFDLEVTLPHENGTTTTWTPVVGTICLTSDISRGSL